MCVRLCVCVSVFLCVSEWVYAYVGVFWYVCHVQVCLDGLIGAICICKDQINTPIQNILFKHNINSVLWRKSIFTLSQTMPPDHPSVNTDHAKMVPNDPGWNTLSKYVQQYYVDNWIRNLKNSKFLSVNFFLTHTVVAKMRNYSYTLCCSIEALCTRAFQCFSTINLAWPDAMPWRCLYLPLTQLWHVISH